MFTPLAVLALTLSPAAARQDTDLASASKLYRASETPVARIEALEAIASLEPSEGGPRAEDITTALAVGLKDEDFLVRARAVELVAAAPARGLAVERLHSACKQQAREEQDRVQRMLEVGELEVPSMFDKGMTKEKWLAALEKVREQTQAVAEYWEATKDIVKVREALVAELPTLPDDRSVGGLALLLEASGLGESADPGLEALLGLPGPGAVKHLAGVFERYDDALGARKKKLRELQRAKPRKKPNDRYADEVWEKKERGRIAETLEKFEANARTMDEWMETVAARARSFAAAQGLSNPPRKTTPGRAWTNWARTEAKTLAPLGRIDG